MIRPQKCEPGLFGPHCIINMGSDQASLKSKMAAIPCEPCDICFGSRIKLRSSIIDMDIKSNDFVMYMGCMITVYIVTIYWEY